jgi:hypothetical protein
MAKFNMTVPHALTQEEALRRVRGEIENLKRQYGDKIGNLWDNWDNNTYTLQGSALGFAVSGTVRVMSLQIEIDGDLPLLATPFKRRIDAEIRERLTRLLS